MATRRPEADIAGAEVALPDIVWTVLLARLELLKQAEMFQKYAMSRATTRR